MMPWQRWMECTRSRWHHQAGTAQGANDVPPIRRPGTVRSFPNYGKFLGHFQRPDAWRPVHSKSLDLPESGESFTVVAKDYPSACWPTRKATSRGEAKTAPCQHMWCAVNPGMACANVRLECGGVGFCGGTVVPSTASAERPINPLGSAHTANLCGMVLASKPPVLSQSICLPEYRNLMFLDADGIPRGHPWHLDGYGPGPWPSLSPRGAVVPGRCKRRPRGLYLPLPTADRPPPSTFPAPCG
jgi:hypothetical protein